jgi:hypothetical protein
MFLFLTRIFYGTNMPSTLANVAWYVIMILCAGGLFVLEIISHDFSTNTYVLFAILALLLQPLIKTVKLILWWMEPKKAVVEEVVVTNDEHTQSKGRNLNPEETRELKLAKLEAEKKVKDMEASKKWERSHNKEAGGKEVGGKQK